MILWKQPILLLLATEASGELKSVKKFTSPGNSLCCVRGMNAVKSFGRSDDIRRRFGPNLASQGCSPCNSLTCDVLIENCSAPL